MKIKISPSLTLYYSLLLGLMAVLVKLYTKSILDNQLLFWVIGIFFLLLPLIIYLMAIIKPAFAKWLRISFFRFFKVSLIAQISLVVILLFIGFLIYNFLSFGISPEQIFLNVFILNLVFLFFLVLVLTNRLQISEPNALLIRKEGTPEVYLYRNGLLRHLPDPPTLQLLGYSFSDVQVISANEFNNYKVGARFESVTTARLVRTTGKPEVYIIIGEEKHHVPDSNTMIVLQMLNKQVHGERLSEDIQEAELNAWPTGQSLKSVIP